MSNIYLKAQRNCILRIICVWSLFRSIRVYTSLHFLPFFWKTSFCFSTLFALCRNEFNVTFTNFITFALYMVSEQLPPRKTAPRLGLGLGLGLLLGLGGNFPRTALHNHCFRMFQALCIFVLTYF